MQQKLSQHDLEKMCLAYLRMLLRSQHITKVAIAARPGQSRNWVVLAVEPTLPPSEDHEARTALAGLQEQFRLAE